MGKSLSLKIISILFASVFGISILFAIYFAVKLNEEVLLMWAYFLSIAAMVITLAFGIVNMFKSKKSILTSLGVLIGFVILVGISYALASDFVPSDSAGVTFDITGAVSRWSGALLYSLYALLGLSFLTLLYTEIRAIFN